MDFTEGWQVCVDLPGRYHLADWLRKATADRPGTIVMGPAPLSVVKINNRYRYRVNLACRADTSMRNLIAQIVMECSADKRFRGVSVFADNDPVE